MRALAAGDGVSVDIHVADPPSLAGQRPQGIGDYSPLATPRAGSLIHSLHEPAYSAPNG